MLDNLPRSFRNKIFAEQRNGETQGREANKSKIWSFEGAKGPRLESRGNSIPGLEASFSFMFLLRLSLSLRLIFHSSLFTLRFSLISPVPLYAF